MDDSDEIEEESPCFIVPDSQNDSEKTKQRWDSTANGSLKELAMLSPANINVKNSTSSDTTTRSLDQEKVGRDSTKTGSLSDGDGSDQSSQCQVEKGTISSSSETSVYPNSTSSSDSSKEEIYQKNQQKLHPVKSLISNQELRRTMTTVRGDAAINSSSQEDLFANFTQGKRFLTSTPMVNPSNVAVVSLCNALSGGNALQAETPVMLFTPTEVTKSSEVFECLRLSGDIKEQDTSSSCDFVSPSSEGRLKPTSPTTENTESDSPSLEGQKSIEKHHEATSGDTEKGDGKEISTASESSSVERRVETGLPKWQSDCLRQESENISSSVGTMSRTTSENSTRGTDTASSPEDEVPSLHQWQSQNENLSDELFDNEHGTPESPSGGSLQVLELPKSSQIQHPKGLELPEMSQDIFHPKRRGTSDVSKVSEEPSPRDNDVIVLSSQEDDLFRLHLTQSQSNSPPTHVAIGPKMGDDRQCQSQSLSATSSHLSPSQSILLQTSPTRRSTLDERDQIQEQMKTNELLDEKREASLTADVTEQMTESADSSQVAFHFSPPTVLLRPVLNITPSPCFEMSSESQKEIFSEPSPPEICSTSEFEPAVLPNVAAKMLSLSAPNHCHDNTDEEEADSSEIGFTLKKLDRFVPDTEREKVVGKAVRSVFTNVRERFQAVDENRPVQEERDPFEFVDEASGSPLMEIRAAKRKRGDVGEPEGKRKKRNKISESIKLDDCESTNTPKRKFWKIVKTRTITTTTTMIERETFVKYTNADGNIFHDETTHEFGEPTYETRCVEGDEIRVEVEVEDVPGGKIPTATRTNERSIAGRQRARRQSCKVSTRGEANLREGSRVLALWFDKHFYPGTLMSRNVGDSRCRVQFDDGDLRDIRERDLLVVDYLPQDQPVMVRERHGDCYDNGIIRGFYRTGHARGYKVAKEDGEVQNCPRSSVILNVEQATIFLSLRSSLSTNNDSLTNEAELIKSPISESFTSPRRSNEVRSSPRTRSADRVNAASKTANDSRVSCDKTAKASRRCDGKAPSASRKSRDNAAKTSTTSPDKAATTSRISPDGDATKRKNARRLSSSETPKSSHKSTSRKLGKKGGTQGDNCGKEDEGRPVGKVRRRLSCAMQATEDKTRAVPTRTSPRKCAIRGDRQDNAEQLVLPSNPDLFRGYGFVITGSNVNSVSCLDDDSPREEDQTFDRGQVRRQVEAGGGVILSTFQEDNVAYLLLSNTCQTTAKYFHALVIGVPCLSHFWLRDCCKENRLICYANYLLPAGTDLVTGRLVEKQQPTNALRDLKVYLVGNSEFVDEWKTILGAAKCQIIAKLPTNVLKEIQYESEDFKCDVIVVGSGHISHSTIRKARLLAVPTVTIQWVKECILTGKRVSFDAHPSFRYAVQGNE